MAKIKRRSRRKEARKPSIPDRQSEQIGPSKRGAQRPVANPPQPNVPVLILSGVLLAVWVVYLSVVVLSG